jgi:actin-related protein
LNKEIFFLFLDICIGDGSKLALHALNIDTGIVFECGHGVTQIVPVLNG